MNAPIYKPAAESLRLSLPDIGERLSAQLIELHKRPDTSKAEMLAIALDGARRHVLAYRERLSAEGLPNGRLPVAERSPNETNAA